MSDISYEILDLMKEYGESRQGLDEALAQDQRPQVLYALAEGRENLLEWLDFSKEDQVLEIGSGYGALTGLLAERCGQVTVLEKLDENSEVNRRRNQERGSIRFLRELDQIKPEEKFQWIFLLHPSVEKSLEEQVGELVPFLAKGGRMVTACSNSLGLPALSGAPRSTDEAVCTLGQLRRALQGAGLDQAEFYYPVPDGRLPGAVYSHRYLPSQGDLPSPCTAYEEGRYACLPEGQVYDQLIGEGDFERFAESFLAVASKGAREQRVIFAKYNRTRKPAFQISTKILEEGGKRIVEKMALKPEGAAHIRSFQDKYEKLKKINSQVDILKPEISEDGRRARFAFLQGRTLEQKLADEIQDRKVPVEAIKEALDFLLGPAEKQGEPFEVTPAFTEVFGTIPDIGGISSPVTNLDGLLENWMEAEGKLCAIDYEWVFDFPIPAGFVRYRLLYYFYNRYQGRMDCSSVQEFLKAFGISQELAAVYAGMEGSFQAYVHGDGNQGYLAGYSHPVITLEELKGRDEELARAKDRILQLQAEVEEKNLQIRKEQEVQRLTNNHVTNLEVMIKDLRHEIDELGKLATYLNGHEALVFKARRKLGVQVNKAFPKGTRKRKLLNYGINTVKHPVRYGRLYATSEGRNRIEGDFQIGDAYMQYGRLSFPQVPGDGKEGANGWEGPMVSIIIPCYNQVGYTYACLQSILEYTKDVTYEVIIADDVSTDATAHLDRYVDGLVICRNSTNQGFLKNCNNAAKKARGKYIFFLNNDTKVTEGWLSSLVGMMEADPTIGIAGSKLVYPDGRLQEAGGIIWSDASGWNYGRLDDPEKPEYNYVKEVDYISGAAILIPRVLWQQIGGFDERFAPAYYEDTDLAFEVRKAGYRVVYQPRSKVIHFEGISNGTDVNGTGLKRYQVENAEKFKEKWAKELKSQCVNDGNPNPFRARERSQGKKMILVVDHYVPTFDKDAGSKATYLYMKMFLKKGFVVKFLGDNFLHEEPYTTALEQMGIEVLYGDWYAAGIWDWLKKNGNEISFAYLNRPHIATKYVDFIKDYTKIKVIYFGHDLHFLRLNREYELDGKIETKREADYWKSMEFSMMYKADMSYYPSYVEINVIHSIDASIRAKAISLYVYDTFKEKLNEDFEKREGLLFVGGFAHPPNADAVLWFAREIFPDIRKELPDVKFYVVGSKVTDEIKALEQPDNGIVIKGFVSDEELERLYATCRVVVVPLRYGAGVKGKVLEALYNGAPVITTSIGAEGIPFVEQALKIEDTAEGFARQTIDLYQNPDLCRQMEQKTQDYMKKYFSLDGTWDIIKDDFT
ncbi:MAG TPA: glycosyltransferase [Candidatus Enterocloster faecavium]|uniref:Glycosyltransferase n=1 Tax=Candidatus Enterocloster faecavium TaxID=2838560 RepID=A0A9D2L688_9FIRM|nr:glycosyltransferase [Candidatus Enterocloster faecavium]